MKFYLILFLTGTLVGCTSPVQNPLPSERIVTFLKNDTILWYGVEVDDWGILTASHVIESCRKWNCRFREKSLSGMSISSHADISFIWGKWWYESNVRERPTLGQEVYLLRYSSWTWRRYDTQITALDKDYIAFDNSLSGVYLTGALEIPLPLEKGESWLPVWTLSWGLVGVVSASDAITGKTYIVQ